MTTEKRILSFCLLAASVATGLRAVAVDAQEADISGLRRKVKTLGKAQYSDLARKLNLSGVVKIEATVGPDGKVRKTRVVGGHPVLAIEAEKAAMQSEFEPGPKETLEVIEFKFGTQ